MRLLFKIFFTFFQRPAYIFLWFLSVISIIQPYVVRVLLDEKNADDGIAWAVSCAHGVFLRNPYSNQISKKKFKKLSISYDARGVYVNNRRCPYEQIFIEALEGPLTFDGRSYTGSFSLLMHKKKLLLINMLDIEDYIFSVLSTESWPGWPLEINKVMAIVCRSYVLAKMRESSISPRPYHVKNTNVHQTYRGIHTSIHLKEAVDKTRHMFLSYDKKPILAMYDSCCGGVIPGNMQGIHFPSAPYLARMYPCTFCSLCKIFNWHVRYSAHELGELTTGGKKIGEIRDVSVIARDAAGVVQQVAIRGARETKYLSGKNVYSLLGKIKSFVFSITKKSHFFTFEGKGYGHHLGLCQWGARELVAKGWKCREILDFYYPGTRLMRLKNIQAPSEQVGGAMDKK